MVGGDLAGDRQTLHFSVGDQLDLFAAADVAKVDGAAVGCGEADAHGDALSLGVHGDELFPGPAPEAGAQGGQVLDAQGAEGVVEVDLEGHRAGGQRLKMIDPFRAGAGKKADVATDGAGGCRAGSVERFRRAQRGRRVGHREHGGNATGQSRRRSGGEVFFVLTAGYAQVRMDVGEARERDRRHSTISRQKKSPIPIGSGYGQSILAGPVCESRARTGTYLLGEPICTLE